MTPKAVQALQRAKTLLAGMDMVHDAQTRAGVTGEQFTQQNEVRRILHEILQALQAEAEHDAQLQRAELEFPTD